MINTTMTESTNEPERSTTTTAGVKRERPAESEVNSSYPRHSALYRTNNNNNNNNNNDDDNDKDTGREDRDDFRPPASKRKSPDSGQRGDTTADVLTTRSVVPAPSKPSFLISDILGTTNATKTTPGSGQPTRPLTTASTLRNGIDASPRAVTRPEAPEFQPPSRVPFFRPALYQPEPLYANGSVRCAPPAAHPHLQHPHDRLAMFEAMSAYAKVTARSATDHSADTLLNRCCSADSDSSDDFGFYRHACVIRIIV